MKITLEVDVFLEFSCFTYDPRLLATWSLVPFSFLNPACTSWSSQFMYCWSLNAFEYYLVSIWNEQSCLFNLYAEYIMWNARLDETQARIKTAGRSINNLRYADETTLMAVSGEELNSLLMNMKEESEKVGLKLNIPKTKIMASGPITSWQIDRETMETMSDFIFFPVFWPGEFQGLYSPWGHKESDTTEWVLLPLSHPYISHVFGKQENGWYSSLKFYSCSM